MVLGFNLGRFFIFFNFIKLFRAEGIIHNKGFSNNLHSIKVISKYFYTHSDKRLNSQNIIMSLEVNYSDKAILEIFN